MDIRSNSSYNIKKVVMKERKKKETKKKVVIRDPSLDPYYIEIDENSYVVYKTSSTTVEGYYPSMLTALEKISKSLLTVRNTGVELNLESYKLELKRINDSITTALNYDSTTSTPR